MCNGTSEQEKVKDAEEAKQAEDQRPSSRKVSDGAPIQTTVISRKGAQQAAPLRRGLPQELVDNPKLGVGGLGGFYDREGGRL